MKLLSLATALLLSSSFSLIHAMQEETTDSISLYCDEELENFDQIKENVKKDVMAHVKTPREINNTCKEPGAPMKPKRKRIRTSTHEPRCLFYKEDSSGKTVPFNDMYGKIFIEFDPEELADAIPALYAAITLFSNE